MLKHLDLFSGIGGWTLGFHATEQIETVGFCEIEKYPQQILKQHYPDTPIFEDVRKLDYEQLRTAGLISDTQRIDILTCSYPCQPFSVAGKKRGEEDPRHLWPEVHRLIRDDRIRPMYVLGENVGGHIRLGLDTVSEDMERSGYRWRCFSIEASCIGANHRRQRVWWIAEDVEYTNNTRDRTPKCRTNTHREKKDERRQEQSQSRVSRSSEDVADTNSRRRTPIIETRSSNKKNKRRQDHIEQSSTGKDVADTNTRLSNRENEEVRTRRNTSNDGSTGGGTEDVANTRSKRLQSSRTTREVASKGEEKERARDKSTFHTTPSSNERPTKDVADTDSKRRRGRKTRGQNAEDVRQSSRRAFTRNWDVEPNVGRVANGVPNRVHRLKALGNAIVPQMAYYIGQALLKDFQHKNHN